MLGRFLEISIHCPSVRESMEFYERLGLVLAATNDIWRHQYAVVTDGRVALGLHAYDFPSPSLTWVHADLARHALTLADRGIHFEFMKTGEEEFNEAGFRDPDGQMVTLLEARTFSPVPVAPAGPVIGYFREYRYPVRSVTNSARFWEPLGFVAMKPDDDEQGPMVLTSDGIDLCLFEGAAQRPQLVFESRDLSGSIAALVARGISGDLVPDLAGNGEALEIRAPEGTRIVITRETV
jgi:catechol 2,3-dioxygenase-like lactoylglutathione lyase family enzyme